MWWFWGVLYWVYVSVRKWLGRERKEEEMEFRVDVEYRICGYYFSSFRVVLESLESLWFFNLIYLD